jgi:hypothetical protein
MRQIVLFVSVLGQLLVLLFLHFQSNVLFDALYQVVLIKNSALGYPIIPNIPNIIFMLSLLKAFSLFMILSLLALLILMMVQLPMILPVLFEQFPDPNRGTFQLRFLIRINFLQF